MDEKIKVIVDYLKRQEKSPDNLNLGPEYEYFVVNRKDYSTVSYYGDYGIEYIFKQMVDLGWKAEKENNYILGLSKDDMTVTTEPGGQFEYSNTYYETVNELEDRYVKFLEEVLPILDDLDYEFLAVGYHPETKIDDIRLLPKSRYDAMFDYFKKHGTMSHNMMKGTAALQLSIDFISEEDYKKKSVVLNGISNILYSLFANAYFFEGQPSHNNIREKIWRNTDPDRSGLSANAFVDDSYAGYAKYLLDRVAIFGIVDGQLKYTKDAKISEFVYEGMPDWELEHLMTMVFPDVRTKNFLEVRVMDSVPYPYNMAAFALIKGLVYDDQNLEKLYSIFKNLKRQEVYEVRDNMYEGGEGVFYMDKTIREWKFKLIDLARQGLDESEATYLDLLEELVEDYGNLYSKTKAIYDGTNKIEALEFNRLRI